MPCDFFLIAGKDVTDAGSCGSFHPLVSASVSCASLYSPVCLSNLGGSGSPCGLPYLMDTRVVDFSVCSPFYLLLRCSVTSRILLAWGAGITLHWMITFLPILVLWFCLHSHKQPKEKPYMTLWKLESVNKYQLLVTYTSLHLWAWGALSRAQQRNLLRIDYSSRILSG